MININDIFEKHRKINTARNDIEQSVAFAFDFGKLPHPFKGSSIDDLDRKRNSYFALVFYQCSKPSQVVKQFRTIFCKILLQLDNVLVSNTLSFTQHQDPEPKKQSWGVQEKFWKSIKDELKDYDPSHEEQTETSVTE